MAKKSAAATEDRIFPMTVEQLQSYARRCATLGRDVAVGQLRIQQGHTNMLQMDALGYMIGVAITAFEAEFDKVIEDPITALAQRSIAEWLKETVDDAQARIEKI